MSEQYIAIRGRVYRIVSSAPTSRVKRRKPARKAAKRAAPKRSTPASPARQADLFATPAASGQVGMFATTEGTSGPVLDLLRRLRDGEIVEGIDMAGKAALDRGYVAVSRDSSIRRPRLILTPRGAAQLRGP